MSRPRRSAGRRRSVGDARHRRRRPAALLVLVVGNPWPGSSRLAMGDEAAVVVGVLAVLVWLVWARFVVAVVGRGPHASSPSCARRLPAAPTPGAAGARHRRARVPGCSPSGSSPRCSCCSRSARGVRRPTPTARRPGARWRRPSRRCRTRRTHRSARRRSVTADVVTVSDGDTLFGLARTHLGDSARWREIFELNRDRPQPDGGRLDEPEPDPHRVAPRAAGGAGRRRPPRPAGRRADRRRAGAVGTRSSSRPATPCGTSPAPGWRRPASTTATSPSPTTCTRSSPTTAT